MKVLITGATGFVGRSLIKLLETEPSLQLYLSSRVPAELDNFYACDLSNYQAVEALIDQVQPEQIYHLAGSFSNHYDTDYQTNVLATQHILNALLKLKLNPRVLLIGSAAEYGHVRPEDNPISEDYPLKPAGVYGLTKAYQTLLFHYYYQTHGLNLVLARTFNLVGEGASPKLFIGRLYAQIAQYKRGEIEKITLGNIQHSRDYIAVEDAVRLYRDIMQHGMSGEIYNVGSGVPMKISDLLHNILSTAGLTMDIVETQIAAYTGRQDVPQIYANINKVHALKSS